MEGTQSPDKRNWEETALTEALLDTSVAIGRKQGIITIFTAIEYPTALSHDFEVILPKNEDFEKSLDISAKLFAIGKPIPAIDVLIASMAILRNMPLLTLDKHFLYVREVEPEFKLEIIK